LVKRRAISTSSEPTPLRWLELKPHLMSFGTKDFSPMQRIGEVIRSGLRELGSRHERIGDVRGTGLYIGVEVVRDRRTKNPNATSALAIVNEQREHGILISATGFNANTLKIRPPLIFSVSNASPR
jgi:4-aminobutyrate aminotransferase-like enzyme